MDKKYYKKNLQKIMDEKDVVLYYEGHDMILSAYSPADRCRFVDKFCGSQYSEREVMVIGAYGRDELMYLRGAR